MARLVIPPTLSVIISIWAETLFYGINIAVYIRSMNIFWLRLRKDNRGTTKGLAFVATLGFLLATAHMGVNVRRLVEGYVNPATKGDMTKYLLDITQPTNVAKQLLRVLVFFLSDLLLVWRIYLVWNKRWLICIPSLIFCCAAFGLGIIGGVYQGRVVPGQSIFTKKVNDIGLANKSLTLATNLSATLLIAGRIWYLSSGLGKIRRESATPYFRMIAVIVESALLSAVVVAMELAFIELKYPAIYFISDSSVQINFMAPLLIIVFVAMESRRENTPYGLSYNTPPEESYGNDMPIEFKTVNQFETSQDTSQLQSSHLSGAEKRGVEKNAISSV